jgi:hypothetical protein
MGPNLSAAAPEAAPGALFAEERRYAEAQTSTSAVAAAVCVGGFIPTSLRSMARRRAVSGRTNRVDVMSIVRVVKGGRQVTRRSDESEVGGFQL